MAYNECEVRGYHVPVKLREDAEVFHCKDCGRVIEPEKPKAKEGKKK